MPAQIEAYPASLVFHSASPDQTRTLGAALGAAAGAGDVILLTGTLGAGKTAFTQGIARGLGVTATVNSPTFTLLKEYEGRLPLYHFDLYRIEDPAELGALGFDEYFAGDGLCVVEWAERGTAGDEADAPWPDDVLRIALADSGTSETGRTLTARSVGPRSAALLRAMAVAAGGGTDAAGD